MASSTEADNDSRRAPAGGRQDTNEKVPLLGPKRAVKSTEPRGLGSGTLAIILVIVVVGTLAYEIHKYGDKGKPVGRGPDLLADYERSRQGRHSLTPAVPSQAPSDSVQRGLAVWPMHPAHSPVEPQISPSELPATEQLATASSAALQSGGLEARIHHENYPPSWHTLGDSNGLLLDTTARPLFTLLPGNPKDTKVTSKDCKVIKQEQTTLNLQLRLSCPSNIAASFEIQAPANNAGYLRFSVKLWSESGAWQNRFSTLRLLEASLPASAAIDLTGPSKEPGLPVVVGGKLFIGGEHPMAFTGALSPKNSSMRGSSTASGVFIDIRNLDQLSEPTELKPWHFGAVIGRVPEKSQARRAFINYLHAERPGRRTPMVHYNSWFDFYGWQDEGFFHETQEARRKDIMTEASCIDRVNEFGKHLVTDHGVKVDSFLIDDGWDNTQTLWEFDKNRFPRGFAKVAEAAHVYGSGVGVWLSPWGGYGDSKKNRVREGKALGLETHIDPWGEEAFDLAGPKYKAWLMKTVMRMRRDEGVNLFKFDGVGRAPREMEAMLSMLADVRDVNVASRASQNDDDKVWLSLTTGTWPSPFFLLWSDNIWRGDGDVGPHPGQEPDDGLSQRQKWIRWRAEKVQEHVVKQSKFFPLSQLMIHGVVLGGHGEALSSGLGEATDVEFAQEVWSFLGLGLQLQELYISPKRMTTSMWALLAEGLKWARANSQVLLDTHWAFGDVSKREVFCTASWDPQLGSGFVLLQNPVGSQQDSRSFSLGAVLELPHAQANSRLEVSVVKAISGDGHASDKSFPRVLEASKTTSISMRHTEVLVLEVRLAS